jgi:hypothetical protein
VVVYALATLGATRLLFFSGHREVAAWEEPPLSSIITIDWGEVNKPVRYLKILAAAGLQGIINQAQQMPVVAQLCSEDDVERFSSEYRRFAYGECQLGGRAVQRLTIGQGMLRGVTLLLSCVDLMRKDDMTRSSRILTSVKSAVQIPALRSPQSSGTVHAVRQLPVQLPIMAIDCDVVLLSEIQAEDRQPRLLVVKDRHLVNLLTACHDLLWSATQIDIELTPMDPIPEHLKDLIVELAAGATSATAARNLHMSGRTVSRRISEIFDRLGAKSPFQAGVIAARRWLI